MEALQREKGSLELSVYSSLVGKDLVLNVEPGGSRQGLMSKLLRTNVWNSWTPNALTKRTKY